MTSPTARVVVEVMDDAGRVVSGSVFCPRCGARIGKASSPSIEYQKRCSGCRRTLAIAIEDARVLIVVEDDVAEH